MNVRKKLLNKVRQLIVRYRYGKIEKKLRKRKRAKVVFLVRETSKWSMTSLYKALNNDERFEPLVVVTIRKNLHKNPEKVKKALSNLLVFFRERNFNVVSAYNVESATHLNLRSFKPDIIFYDEPWQNKQLDIFATSKFALSCYVPYGFMIADRNDMHYKTTFQSLLWRFFAPQHLIKMLYIQEVPDVDESKIIVCGYPKLDYYLNIPQDIDEGKYWNLPEMDGEYPKKIIYAPHWTITENSPFYYGTFIWSGIPLLEYAKKHKNISWVFKPHPLLRYELIKNNVMSEIEVENYYKKWGDLSNSRIYEDGEYFDIFTTSDALITDCGSFLFEYLPTQKPILHLINPKSVGYNAVGKTVINSFYKIYNFEELERIINKVVVKEDDYLKKSRVQVLSKVELNKTGAGKTIKDYLSDCFF